MKIRFYCDNGANIHSRKQETFSLSDLGLTEEEWREMTEEGKIKMVEEWMWDSMEVGFEELP